MPWQFQAEDDDKVCDECSAYDGEIANDKCDLPFVPIHPNCRCHIVQVDEEMAKEGLHEDSAAYPLNPPPVRSPKPSYLPQYNVPSLPQGWTLQHYDAALEHRKARSIRRGTSAEEAHGEAAEHLGKALPRGLQPPTLYTHSHLHGHGPGSSLAGTVHKHAHTHIAGQPHPDPRFHHHTHTGQGKEKLTESFKWLMPFKHVFDGVKHLIKGNAITVGRTRNKVPYTAEELLRSARTLTQKPLLINHLETLEEVEQYISAKADQIPPPVMAALRAMLARAKTDVGHVVDSEFEDDAVEYVAQVTDPATEAALPLVKGVSIGAVPRVNSTPPQGIIFTDLSLIFEPEIPGDPDASATVMEKLREMLQPAKVTVVDVALEQRRRVNAEILLRANAELTERRRLNEEILDRIRSSRPDTDLYLHLPPK